MKDLICDKLKEIIDLQEIIKTDDLSYKSKSKKIIILVNVLCLLFF